MILPFSSIKRSTKPIPKRRKKPRRGKATSAEKSDIRRKVITRSSGYCELTKSERCIPGVLPENGPDPWSHGHLVHIKSQGSGGKTDMDNCFWGCWHCHLVELHNPKSVPPK